MFVSLHTEREALSLHLNVTCVASVRVFGEEEEPAAAVAGEGGGAGSSAGSEPLAEDAVTHA